MSKTTAFLFSWQDIDAKSDLDRLKLVLDTIPDERLMLHLEQIRGNGRNDYPVRSVWNAILAGIVYQHSSIESLRRELSRNGELRQICGFDPVLGDGAVPSSSAFTHFLKNLMKVVDKLEGIFDQLVEDLGRQLPDFGQRLAIDGKAIESAGKPSKKLTHDGRRDLDAKWGKHQYKGTRPDGTLWTKVKSWFGYTLHLLVDTTYEIPVNFTLTAANSSESKEVIPLIEDHEERHPIVGSRSEILTADRGYDDTKIIKALYDQHGIKPVIDIRNCWQAAGDEVAPSPNQVNTRQLYAYHPDNIVYDYRGGIYCICLKSHQLQSMAFSGFEKDRDTLKYTCPVKAYAMTCNGQSECPHFLKSIRIPTSLNRRIFTPIARSSYKWKREYKHRSAIERVNSRIADGYGFDKHTIRGKRKMYIRLNLAMIVMLSMALGHVKAGRKEVMRSLICAAA